MPQLTPGEYDDLSLDAQQALGRVVQQPHKDKKSKEYRKWKGRYMNGEIDADPRSLLTVGHGTGDPKAPAPSPIPTQPPKVTPEG